MDVDQDHERANDPAPSPAQGHAPAPEMPSMHDLRSVSADLDEIDEVLARLDGETGDETGHETDETSAVDEPPSAETGRVDTDVPPGSDDWLATAVDPMSGPGPGQDDDGPDDQAPSFAIR